MRRLFYVCLVLGMMVLPLTTRAEATTRRTAHHGRSTIHESARVRRRMSSLQHSRPVAGSHAVKSHAVVSRSATSRYVRAKNGRLRRVGLRVGRHRSYEHFTGSSFTDTDVTAGDITTGEDPVVRAAAVQALGNMNGTVVAIDPSNGRVLAMVNQKLALSSGAEPCSTIKLSVALAALEEGIITKDTPVNLGGSYHVNLTEALAKSNNLYFETLGRRLGFERIRHYANQFGLGELAGYNIPGEQLGIYPDEVLPESAGGVGRMCSFGEGVSMTPLQLGALVASIANGGTLYYLQYPKTFEEAALVEPRVKRRLDIEPLIPEIKPGLAGAVEYGTARRAGAESEEMIYGKTGTCTDSRSPTHLGWFASFTDAPSGKVAVVVLLTGAQGVSGPAASAVAGNVYRNLDAAGYFGQPHVTASAHPATHYALASNSDVSSSHSATRSAKSLRQ